MNVSRRSFRAIATAVVSALSISCGEMAVRVKGRFVDAAGTPKQNCIVTVLSRGQTVGEFRVAGAFDETAVFRRSTADQVIVRGACYGTRDSFEKEIRIPEKFNTPVELGDVVFP